MIRTTIQRAKNDLEDLIEAARRGEEVVIATDDMDQDEVRIVVNRPSVRTSSSDDDADADQPVPTFGSAKGKLTVPDDFDDPLEDFEDYQ